MNNEILVPALLVVSGLTATGAVPIVKSFDRNGLLTFREVPGAQSYRVEWSPNLLAGSWTTSPPGIAFLPALGTGEQSVMVSVAEGRGFYRVVPLMNSVTSGFPGDSQEWKIVDYPFHSHSVNPATSPLAWDGTVGNPEGSVRVGDVYGETGIAAPAAFLGNRLAFYGGSLTYDILIRYTDNATYPAVVLNGGTVSLYYDAPSPPLNVWQQRVVPLSETGWKVSGSGAVATPEVFKTVLSQLVGLYIYTEWHTGADDTNVDNISIAGP